MPFVGVSVILEGCAVFERCHDVVKVKSHGFEKELQAITTLRTVGFGRRLSREKELSQGFQLRVGKV